MTGPVPAMHLESSKIGSVNGAILAPVANNEISSSAPSNNPSRNMMERNNYIQSEESITEEALGTPFNLEWIKVLRLPFARTRTIVNSFNMNREVKISRDGSSILTLSVRGLYQVLIRVRDV